MKTPIYLSAGFDEKIAVKHPEWLARRSDERLYWVTDFMHPGFHRLCMNSPYLDYLLEQIKEVCIKFKPDGIFLDIVDVLPCYCENCLCELRSHGLDPNDEKNIMNLAPQNKPADYELSKDGVIIKIKSFKCHQMIVVDV
ncbi:MAG: hypothetical protein SOW78_10500 [Clostridia bacterium]|nr:hypothetical protein [Clostridia bacterium]